MVDLFMLVLVEWLMVDNYPLAVVSWELLAGTTIADKHLFTKMSTVKHPKFFYLLIILINIVRSYYFYFSERSKVNH